jgi:hypothetical protein
MLTKSDLYSRVQEIASSPDFTSNYGEAGDANDFIKCLPDLAFAEGCEISVEKNKVSSGSIVFEWRDSVSCVIFTTHGYGGLKVEPSDMLIQWQPGLQNGEIFVGGDDISTGTVLESIFADFHHLI